MGKRQGIMLCNYPIDSKLKHRFWSKVDISNNIDDCWEWRASFGFRDYGKIRIGPTYVAAHRVAYYITNGAFNESLNVCHSCDNPKCCNPNHLFLGTQSDNNFDKIQKGRHKYETPWARENFNKEHRWRNHHV